MGKDNWFWFCPTCNNTYKENDDCPCTEEEVHASLVAKGLRQPDSSLTDKIRNKPSRSSSPTRAPPALVTSSSTSRPPIGGGKVRKNASKPSKPRNTSRDLLPDESKRDVNMEAEHSDQETSSAAPTAFYELEEDETIKDFRQGATINDLKKELDHHKSTRTKVTPWSDWAIEQASLILKLGKKIASLKSPAERLANLNNQLRTVREKSQRRKSSWKTPRRQSAPCRPTPTY